MDRFVRQRIVTPRIVQPDSHPLRWLLVLVLVLWAVSSWFIYDFGREHGGHDNRQAAQLRTLLEDRISQLERQRDKLTLEQAAVERSGQIDRDAAAKAQQTIASLQQQTGELRKEVQFLRGVLSNNKVSAVLRLRDFRLQAVGPGQSYRYQFTLTQLTKVGGSAQGEVVLSVSGTQDGQAKVLALPELTTEKLKSLAMRFKSFQDFEGVLVLPVDFLPDSLTISVTPKGKTLKPFTEVYDWRAEDSPVSAGPEEGKA